MFGSILVFQVAYVSLVATCTRFRVKKTSNSCFNDSFEFKMSNLVELHIWLVYVRFRMNFKGPFRDFCVMWFLASNIWCLMLRSRGMPFAFVKVTDFDLYVQGGHVCLPFVFMDIHTAFIDPKPWSRRVKWPGIVPHFKCKFSSNFIIFNIPSSTRLKFQGFFVENHLGNYFQLFLQYSLINLSF